MKKKGTNRALIPAGLPRTRVIFCLGIDESFTVPDLDHLGRGLIANCNGHDIQWSPSPVRDSHGHSRVRQLSPPRRPALPPATCSP